MTIRRGLAALASLCLLIMSLTFASPAAHAQEPPGAPGLIVVESTQTFEATWSSLIGALDANPNIRIIAQVDHGAAATAAELTLDGSRVVFFGNPALGTPIMQASRTAGIDLPQKMHVFEEAGSVFVAYNAPSYLSARHATGDVATLTTIEGALAGFANTAANAEGSVPSTPVQGNTTAGAGLTSETSASDFETTWDQLITAIDGSPASIAFIVDHSANSGGVLPPTRLVVFGNPTLGTPFMASSPSTGVDLPLKMLVYEDDSGVTHVVSTSPGFVQSRHSAGSVATVGAANSAVANFTEAAIQGDGAPVVLPAVEDEAESDSEPAEESDATTDDEVLGTTELAITGTEPLAPMLAALLIAVGGVFVIGARRIR